MDARPDASPTTMSTLPPSLTARVERIDAALGRELERISARLVGLHPELTAVTDHLSAFVRSGGKRLRPLWLLLGWRAARPDAPEDPALPPALALELLHACALVHDDLMDAAATRRGRPTVHVAFADDHVRARWAGDPARYGLAGALLVGDLAFVLADELFLRALDAGAATEHVLAAFRRFTTTREELTAGQFLDLVAGHRTGASSELALVVASHKSGRYSVARPLEIGAILAGGESLLAEALVAAGEPLGQAFQLRDDVLGVFGRERETGKSTRSDLVEGKRTLLVTETLQRLDAPERERFEELLGTADLTEPQADELRRLMRRSGGLAATESRLEALLAEGLGRLDELPLTAQVRADFTALATHLVTRQG